LRRLWNEVLPASVAATTIAAATVTAAASTSKSTSTFAPAHTSAAPAPAAAPPPPPAAAPPPTKLYHYLQQQKVLEAKIRAAERAAKKHNLTATKAAVKPSHNAKVQTTFIRTIAKALYDNKQAIKKDEDAAAHLKRKQQALFASMKALKHSDELLFQKVNSESHA